jgi:hypothetical protein
MNQGTLDYVYQRFTEDFGVRPFIVRETSWDYAIVGRPRDARERDFSQAIRTDDSYAWAAATRSFRERGGVAAVGPGYDDRSRSNPRGTRVDRQDGALYAGNLQGALQSGRRLVAIETWNELHEGSSIAETIEFGRKYIDMTRDFAAAFHGRAAATP